MNTIIKLSTKAERLRKDGNEKTAADEEGTTKNQRGAPMVSRSGHKTNTQHTCFFRGVKGETGGKTHAEAESSVKKLRNFANIDLSDVSKDLVEKKDISQYITVQENKKEEAKNRVLAEIAAL